MLATMTRPAEMSQTSSPPKRPRLSLQIKSSTAPTTLNKSSTALKADIDMTSPTAFNTLSNAYAAAISLASPRAPPAPNPLSAIEPKTAINTARSMSLRLNTNTNSHTPIFPSQRTQTPGPFTIVYPDTPTTSSRTQTPITAHPGLTLQTPTFTFTPPQSAHPSSPSTSSSSSTASVSKSRAHRFNFSITTTSLAPSPVLCSPRTPRRRATTGSSTQHLAPYTHPRSLHSILRNSPLPPRTATSPLSPTRASARLAERAARAEKRVGYNNPLTQTITTERYVKSHIDLLAEEASPNSALDAEKGGLEINTSLDLTMAYTGDETRDGGQTPGPFEEMRRRMAGLGGEGERNESETETAGGKKRKRREKKRAWVWTIGVNEEENDGEGETQGTSREGGVVREDAPADGGLETLSTSVYIPAPTPVSREKVELGMERMDVDESRPGTAHSI